jgi:hypothetical protein
MSVLDQGIANVQNPAYAAALLTGFVEGYRENHPLRNGSPLPYLFVAVPMLLQSEILDNIRSTQLGLRGMVRKLTSSEVASTDVVLSISEHARDFRSLTIEALAIMLATRLVKLVPESGAVVPMKAGLSSRGELPRDYSTAIKLGKWFSELSMFEIASTLKVTF